VIEGLSHLTFIVRDLERMSRLLVNVLGGREVYSSGDATFSISREKFFIVGGLWVAIMEGEPLKERTYNHVAFKVREQDLDDLKRQIVALGLETRQSRPRVEGEGASIYFHDWDNHLFELHTGTLDDRLRRYAEGR
jgi:catechol 2,3-dioxygenase-like lactoylglutathione lyase family enzyme